MLESPPKREGLENKIQLNRKLISFPRSERLRIEGADEEEENHRSLGKAEKNLTSF